MLKTVVTLKAETETTIEILEQGEIKKKDLLKDINTKVAAMLVFAEVVEKNCKIEIEFLYSDEEEGEE